MDPSPIDLSSSPVRSNQSKEKRKSSVTPRRFGRFFTPRSTSLPSARRRILANLDDASLNRQPLLEPLTPQSLHSDPLSSDPILPSPSEGLDNHGERRKRKRTAQPEPGTKRRGALFEDILSQPGQAREPRIAQEDGTNVLDKGKATLDDVFKSSRFGVQKVPKTLFAAGDIPAINPKAPLTVTQYQPRPIRKFANRGFESQLLDREHGFSRRSSQLYLATPACDFRAETAPFHSRQNDLHHCLAYRGPGNTIPFSLASSHRSPVTAIGDEQGFVRFLDTTSTDNLADDKVRSSIALHDNAIMDMAFSEDDMRLATACGDRTGRILDMPTQTVVTEFNGPHWDSLRQVAFQPGPAGGNVIASSDRAGQVHVWDLRCSPMPCRAFSTNDGRSIFGRDTTLDIFPTRSINNIEDGHMRKVHGNPAPTSVTALQWLPAGREHLLLTGSEANASIKLWDTRYIKPRNQAVDVPLATTLAPSSHKARSWGITSLALGAGNSRLYAVCKDSTVYAYSLPHLLLGYAPELAPGAIKRRPGNAEGLGPIYGFRHQSFRANTFYVKCAIRPANPDQGTSELLAVGSSDSCAVVFPTDERYMRSAWAKREHQLPSSSPSSLPISRAGTALIRGHSREVTTVSWSSEGKLITASDDYVVRHWQEGDTARHLRQVGEFGGERHMAGWADVSADWDEDD